MSPPVTLPNPGGSRSTSPCAPPDAAAYIPDASELFDVLRRVVRNPQRTAERTPHRLGARATARRQCIHEGIV
ncbi:hypothetical protein MAGR_56270 [Mycolicibacterium agri]|uniref:Uncharacterized protein n=1 Tax=Mycolicibacterium agri TaxID=36811 RepID=A0A7I9WAD9_MYCAG|nr:hypothetical protein MAGR_56270 [Mycolicibacterium agri]